MQIKMKEILSFQSFYEKIKNKTLPIKTSYKISKLFKEVNSEIEFYQTKLIEISEKYGERDEKGELITSKEKGEGIKIQQDKLNECQIEISELLNLEVEIPDITFNLEELDKLELTIEEVELIEKFITE